MNTYQRNLLDKIVGKCSFLLLHNFMCACLKLGIGVLNICAMKLF